MGTQSQHFYERLDSLKRNYVESLVEKIASMEIAREELFRLSNPAAGLDVLKVQAHNLKGSAASFGFDEIGASAGNLDLFLTDVIENSLPLTLSRLQHLQMLFEDLRDAVTTALEGWEDKASISMPEIQQEPVKPSATKVGRILVAEDQLTNQKIIARLLTGIGYECDIASNGREAVEIWEKNNYALILMDCLMPEIDGFQATAMIRGKERQTGGRIPIIAMTAESSKQNKDRCIAAGMDDYLVKPVPAKALASTIKSYLGPASSSDIV